MCVFLCISDLKKVYVDLEILNPCINETTFSYLPANKINFMLFNSDISAAFSRIKLLDENSFLSFHFLSCEQLKLTILTTNLLNLYLILVMIATLFN